jgi:hypothetical protein
MLATHGLAGRVKRYHTWPVLHQETVGEHTHRVATLFLQLFGIPRAEVLAYILQHDSGELSSGDMPFYAKRDVPELKHYMNRAEGRGRERLRIEMPKLTDEEWAQFKLCDLLQMLEFALIEMSMGNRFAGPIRQNVLDALSTFEGLPMDQIDTATFVVMAGIPTGEKA